MVRVPVLVNTRKILKGAAVVVKCDPPPPPKAQSKQKLRTWEHDAKRAVSKKGRTGS